MTSIKTKETELANESATDLLVPLCTKVLFGLTGIIGVWGVVCLISGMVSVGGPVALLMSLVAIFA